MAYRVSTPENSILDFRAGRTRYDYDSYFDTLDTEISELLTVPEISNFKIEAAKDFGGTGTGWAKILNSKGLSHFPRESPPASGVIAEEINAYVPEGNPTDFSYGYAENEHALFFVKTISPNREFAKYYWEVNGERKSDGPILTLYNLSDTGTDIQTVTCVAVDPRGRERRQSLTYICSSSIYDTGGAGTYREKGLGYLAPNLSVFYDTSLSEEQRQKPFDLVVSDDNLLQIKGLTFASWKDIIKQRDRVRFKNAGIDESYFGKPYRILNDDDSLSGAFLEIYDRGWKYGTGGGKQKNNRRMDGYSNNAHRERYPTPSGWLEAVFLGDIRPYWNVIRYYGGYYGDPNWIGIEIDWKD